MRAFIALDLSPDLLDHAERVQRKLEKVAPPKTIRLTPREKMHVTLEFFASIEEQESKALVLPILRTNAIELQGLDAFPTQRRATVIVILIRDASGALPSKAHLTVARMRRKTDVRAWLPTIEPASGKAIAVTLYESRSGQYLPITSTRFP